MKPTYESGSLLFYANCQGYPAGPGQVGDLSVTTNRGAIFRGDSLADASSKRFYANDGSPENCERVLKRHYDRLITRLLDEKREFGAVLSLTTCDDWKKNRLFNYPNNPISIVDARTLTTGPSGFANRATVDLVTPESFSSWWKSINSHVRWLKSLGVSHIFADNAFAAASSGGTIPEDVLLVLITRLYGLCKKLKLTLYVNASVCPQHWALEHVNATTPMLMGNLAARCHARYLESWSWPLGKKPSGEIDLAQAAVELQALVENERKWVVSHRRELVILPIAGGPPPEWCAAFAMLLLTPLARVAVSHPWFAPAPEWADLPAKLGKPKGPANWYTLGSYWARTFEHGSVMLEEAESECFFSD